MLYGLLIALFVIMCFFLIFIILLQRGKSSAGMGFSGNQQMLFGGSGGQDIFQKITWALGFIFIAGSLFLAIKKSSLYNKTKYLESIQIAKQETNPVEQKQVEQEQASSESQ